jgi:hypothetical protein
VLRRAFSGIRFLGQLGTEGLRAEARWELEVSRTILARRKKVLLAALLPVLLLLGGELALAALPETIGGNKAYLPEIGRAHV